MSSAPLIQDLVNNAVVDKQGKATRNMQRFLQTTWNTALQAFTIAGQILASTQIQGRTEGIGTTTSQLTSAGKLASTDSIAADGTGSPLTGGKRGFQALDANNRLAGTFHNNPVNAFANFTSSNPLSATTGGSANQATISIAANQQQYGDGMINYSSGSITPLNDNTTYYVYADDPTFAGGAVTYHATTSISTLTAANGRVYFGSVKTPAFGGGGTSGSGGGSGGKGGFY